MTVFYTERYLAGGLHTHGGDVETHHDEMPDDLRKVWEIEPADPNDTAPWVRGGDDIWTVEGQADEGLALSWTELLDEFGPVSDEEADAAIGLDALAARNAAATTPVGLPEELRQAAARLRANPELAAGFGEALTEWLEHTADNMSDEAAFEQVGVRPDGSTYRQVVTNPACHIGLPSEWTAALATARKINQVEVPA